MDSKEVSVGTQCSEEKLVPPVEKRRRAPPALERVDVVLEENGGEGSEHSEVEEVGGEESSTESSDSGSTSSPSSSASSSSVASVQRPSSFTNLFEMDDSGEYLNVACNTNEARFYLSRFARGSIGRCVLFRGRWITPNEFQAVSGRQSSKDWKRSIRLKGRCLKEYIAQGLFQEHLKSCTCRICAGEDAEHLRQEGEMALAAKRRRLSQADSFASGSHAQGTSEPANLPEVPVIKKEEGERVGEEYVGPPPAKKRKGRPPKSQRVWSPSGEVAQDISSNDEDYKPGSRPLPQPLPQAPPPGDSEEGTPGAIIDASDYLPRRSRRTVTRKVGHRTELGTFTRKPQIWDAEEVAEFLRLQGFADYADLFLEAEIDGDSLFMLKEHHLLERFSMKLGPSLKLLDTISRLKHPPIP